MGRGELWRYRNSDFEITLHIGTINRFSSISQGFSRFFSWAPKSNGVCFRCILVLTQSLECGRMDTQAYRTGSVGVLFWPRKYRFHALRHVFYR